MFFERLLRCEINGGREVRGDNELQRTPPASLSITHKFCRHGESELNVDQSGEASPHDDVAGWRVAFAI